MWGLPFKIPQNHIVPFFNFPDIFKSHYKIQHFQQLKSTHSSNPAFSAPKICCTWRCNPPERCIPLCCTRRSPPDPWPSRGDSRCRSWEVAMDGPGRKPRLIPRTQQIPTLWLWLIVCHGKSPFWIGKPSINGPFSMAMLNNQRVPFSEHRCGQLPGVFAMLVEPRDPLWATGIQGNMMTKNHEWQLQVTLW